MDDKNNAKQEVIQKKPVLPFLSPPLLILGLLIVISLIATALFLLNGNKSKQSTVPNAVKAPRFQAENYTDFSNVGNSAKSFTSPQIKEYSLRSDLSVEDASSLAQRVGLSDYKESDGTITYSNLNDAKSAGMLIFNKKSGVFSFKSASTVTPKIVRLYPTYKPKPQEVAISMIQDLGIYDKTISCPITYKRKSSSALTFVECHRDWNALGAPLVNLGGLLNLPEQLAISKLAVGKTGDFAPADETIYATSTKEDGKARPNDFNTITVGVTPDGTVSSVVSTMRWLNKNTTSTSVISPQEALALVKEGKANFSLSLPAGQGMVDPKKIYPDNQAVAKNANIFDTMLVYLDNPINTGQTEYKPYYIFRGSATLSSGYTVRFVQAIEASTTAKRVGAKFDFERFFAKVLKTKLIGQACAVEACEPPTPLPTPEPEICMPAKGGNQITFEVEGYGTLVLSWNGSNTFFLVSTTGSKDYNEVYKAFLVMVKKQLLISVAKDLYGPADFDSPYEHVTAGSFRSSSDVLSYLQTRFTLIPNNHMYFDPQFANKAAVEIYDMIQAGTLQAYVSLPDIFNRGKGAQDFGGVLDKSDYDWPTYQSEFTGQPCYISGVSPAVFVYNVSSTHITLPQDITYVDPAPTDNSWDVNVLDNGMLSINNAVRDFVYYEYSPKVKLSKPNKGFVVKSNDWYSFITTLSSKLELTQKEKDQLITEVYNVLKTMPSSSYLKFMIANQNEVEKELPLHVSPSPESLYRIHVLVAPLSHKESIEQPIINPIERNGFTIVELGARN